MLARDSKRLALILGPILMVLWLTLQYWRNVQHGEIVDPSHEGLAHKDGGQVTAPQQHEPTPATLDADPRPQADSKEAYSPGESYHVLYSVSTPNKQFFEVKFGQYEGINPNIIPHYAHEDEYIIVAQKNQTFEQSPYFSEVACVAKFTTPGLLDCVHLPFMLPIAATFGNACPESIKFVEHNVGPHDARVFWGPEKPFALWQSTSRQTCISQYMQDFRVLFDWGKLIWDPDNFFTATEIIRPEYKNPIEKNWFVFWDADNQLYAHYDIFPTRSFAKVALDGSIGQDLAPQAKGDEECLARFMPKFQLNAPDEESIHQATNSLSITLCKRADPECKPTDANTFLITIFHHKQYIDMSSYYEPYVMMFQNRAPFAVSAVSERPLWIHGRKMNEKHSQMFFLVSMSWKGMNQTYHGYLDDEMFVSIGIEDKTMGGIDVLASELLHDIRDC